MIEAVFFDLDVVIIDSEPMHQFIEKQIFETLKISVSPRMHDSFVGTSERQMFEIIISTFTLEISIDELIDLKRSEYMNYIKMRDSVVLNPGIVELLNDLYSRNYKLAIASSSDQEIIEFFVQKFKLGEFFSTLVSGTNLEKPKPAPNTFLETAQLINSNPEDCLVIEDSKNGVQAARRSGMKCIGYIYENSGKQNLELAHLTIQSFNEIEVDHLDLFPFK